MKLSHLGHACVLLETASSRLLFDPGSFSSGFEDLEVEAVLITHQHYDHLDVERLRALLERNADAVLVVDPGSQEQTAGLGKERIVAAPGDRLRVAGATVDVLGGRHAVIHPDVPVIPNVAYLVDDGAFLHPGDSFHVPDGGSVDVLGLPTGAPWLKASEAVEYLRAVAPRVAVPIHQAVLSRPEIHYALFEKLGPASTTVTILPSAEQVTLD